MKSEATITQDRLRSVLMSKKLKNILAAYFDLPKTESLQHIVKRFKDTLKYWSHESDIDYDVLVKLFELKYDSEVDFEISDKKISFSGEKYGSWLSINNLHIFIVWNVINW